MGYVMVPVPEHHEKEFGQWLLKHTLRAALAAWNPERLQAAADRLDEEDRQIVRRVAGVRGFWVDAQTVADDLDLPLDTMLERIEAMNHDAYEADSPAIIMVRSAEQSRTGRPAFMTEDVIREDLLPLLG